MSGHSKWASIKHKKAQVDAKRGNSFTKLANTITVAAKQGGGDPVMNPSLRLSIDKARAANMPKDNIERAIKRGTGESGGAVAEEVLYEGFGPGNVAILVEALTDNRNRSNSDIRTILNKNGGRIADGGGVAYQFDKRGVLRADVSEETIAQFEEAVIEGGAEDYNLSEDFAIIYTDPAELHTVKEALDDSNIIITDIAIELVPKNPVDFDEEVLEKVSKLIDILEENDDVTNVYTNIK